MIVRLWPCTWFILLLRYTHSVWIPWKSCFVAPWYCMVSVHLGGVRGDDGGGCDGRIQRRSRYMWFPHISKYMNSQHITEDAKRQSRFSGSRCSPSLYPSRFCLRCDLFADSLAGLCASLELGSLSILTILAFVCRFPARFRALLFLRSVFSYWIKFLSQCVSVPTLMSAQVRFVCRYLC